MELTFDVKDFVAKTKLAIVKPKVLFNEVAKEKNWKTTLTYSIAISIVASLLGMIQSLFLFPLIKPILPPDLQDLQTPTLIEALPAFLLSTVVIVLLTFVWCWFLHNWLKLFKVKGDFWDSYKAYVYSRAPLSLLGWIPWVGALAGLYSIYVLIIGVSKLYGITLKKSFLLILPLILIMVVMQLYFFQFI